MSHSPDISLWARLRAFAVKWRNTSLSALDHLWLLLLWAASTPVFLATLGAEAFGVWTMVNALIGLGGFASFGFGEATVRFVSKYKAAHDMDRVRKVVETSMAYYAAAGLFFAILIYATADWIPAAMFDLGRDLEAQTAAALKAAAVILFVTSYQKTLESTINGFQRFDITAKAGMITRSFIILGNVVLALNGFGIAAMVAMAAVGLTGQTLLYYAIIRTRFVHRFRIVAWPSPDVSPEILRFGLQAWVQISSSALGNIVDRFLVGALIGPAAAGIYAICLQLAQQIFLLSYRGLAFLTPLAAELAEARAAPGDFLPPLRGGYSVVLLIVGITAVPLLVLATQILTFWVGPEIAAQGGATLKFMAVFYSFQAMTIAPFMMLNGFGRPGWNTLSALTNGVATIVLAAILLPQIGLLGAIVARILAHPAAAISLVAFHRIVAAGKGWAISIGFTAYVAAVLAIWYPVMAWAERQGQPGVGVLILAVVATSAAGGVLAGIPIIARKLKARAA